MWQSHDDGTHYGMGLAILHGATSDSGGRVWHEHVTPHGARFVLELPIAANEAL